MLETMLEDGAHNASHLLNLIKCYAVLRQPVTLASGAKSNLYIDCRQVYFRGDVQFWLGELLFKKMLELEARQGRFEASSGMAMGSIPLSIAITQAAFRYGRQFPGCAVRKDPKQHGTKALIEGSACLREGSPVLMVEDVVTTASSAIKALMALREAKAQVDTAFCIIDREQGGRENLADNGVTLYSLFTLKDLEE